MLDFIRIACAVPPVKVGDTVKNAADIGAAIGRADDENVDVLVFPELALTGYSCQDLFFQDTLYEGVKAGVRRILDATREYPKVTAIAGLPVRSGGKLYNCAGVFRDGHLLGLTPKTFLPNYSGFSEKRWFAAADYLPLDGSALADLDLEEEIPILPQMILELGEGTKLGIEICEDLLTPMPPSNLLALAGAEVIVNLSASNELAGKADFRRERVRHQSSALNCIYAYCSCGYTESTQDLVFSGQCIIAENGRILEQSENAIATDYMMIRDCDLGRIRADRRKNTTFRDAARLYAPLMDVTQVPVSREALRSDGEYYHVRKLPFIPDTQAERTKRCLEIFQIQVTGLKQRLAILGSNAVIGISGGLDSTLALLVAVEAMRQLGRPMTDVYGVTMPCFGTSDRTYSNSWELMRKLGISAKEINIRNAVSGHFADIGHDPSVHNGTFENSQARERTQILMDYASVVGGIVVGTGDLSELALGWCTYNGDHMSMYGVNGTVPKTLIRWIIQAVSEQDAFAAAQDVLMDILDTPISPELLPPDAEGKISQQTEDLVGPYALHDFFLYYAQRFGFAPKKIYFLACKAFKNDFDGETIKKWLKVFYRRFFTQQFKRNCMPDGVKVGSVGLGPRGDWQMPSEASAKLWLEEADNL